MLAFQPHRYSRTRDCFEDFVKVIGQGCDSVLLSEVYAAGEAPIVAADGRSLARALRVAGKVEPVFVDQIADMPQAVMRNRVMVMCSLHGRRLHWWHPSTGGGLGRQGPRGGAHEAQHFMPRWAKSLC